MLDKTRLTDGADGEGADGADADSLHTTSCAPIFSFRRQRIRSLTKASVLGRVKALKTNIKKHGTISKSKAKYANGKACMHYLLFEDFLASLIHFEILFSEI